MKKARVKTYDMEGDEAVERLLEHMNELQQENIIGVVGVATSKKSHFVHLFYWKNE